jgi:hypothetical protein
MGEEKGFIADLTPGSVDEKALNPGGFPTEAWEFTKAGDANPTLTLKSAWDLVVAGDQSVSGALAVIGALSAGSGTVSGAWDVGSLTLGGTTAGISLSGVDLTLTPGTDGRIVLQGPIKYNVIDTDVLDTEQTQTLPHGLGAKPSFVAWCLLCVTAEYGYAIGDEAWNVESYPPSDRFIGIKSDATNFMTRIKAAPMVQRFDAYSYGVITAANWKIRIRYLP